jgi:hypothetical protein
MKKTAFKILFWTVAVGTFSAVLMPFTLAQSQALNGQIEGTVLDQNNAAVPDVLITVTNIESGATRTVTYQSTFWTFFVQDDWKITRKLKFNYGARYGLYRIPRADPTSPFPASQKFKVDKNNFAPRLGIVFTLREGRHPSIVRAGAELYYEGPWLNMYERALLRNGNARFFNFSIPPASNVAPAFPGVLGSLPAGSVLPPQDIDAIAPDLENMYAIHSNIQLEQAITNNLSFAAGYIHSAGRHRGLPQH